MRPAPPTTSFLPLTWSDPPVADTADRRARVWADAHLRRRWGIGNRRQQMVVLGMASVVLALWAPREGLMCVGALVTTWLWMTRGMPLVVARRLRAADLAGERLTVRLDDEGVHQTSPDVDLDYRWPELRSARIREGFLVLSRQERDRYVALCLDNLGPGVDHQTLLDEVRRRIAAAA